MRRTSPITRPSRCACPTPCAARRAPEAPYEPKASPTDTPRRPRSCRPCTGDLRSWGSACSYCHVLEDRQDLREALGRPDVTPREAKPSERQIRDGELHRVALTTAPRPHRARLNADLAEQGI